MAPEPKKSEPTLFEVLALTPKSLEGQDPQTQTKAVKQAYRRALLKHHPDKNQQAKTQEGNGTSQTNSSFTSSKSSSEVHYTVDQIADAYNVLSNPKKRRDYMRSLATQTQARTTTTHHYSFKAGVETVDLDDLSWDDKRGFYYRSCRCGNPCGFCFREIDLDEVGEEGELMVECVGCSLWLRVLFEEVDDDEEEGEEAGGGSSQVHNRSAEKTVGQGSGEGQKGKWSWSFNFGISIGGGASASAGARRS